MTKLAFTGTLLLIALTSAGCYTQIGYHETSYLTRRPSSQVQNQREKTASQQEEQAPVEVESEQSQTETDDAEEDEGYYGRRKPTTGDYSPYYLPYDYDYYPPYRYYDGYYLAYPYYGYWGYPYGYYGYGHHRGYYGRRYHGARTYYRNSDLHHGRRRSQSYRGVQSSRPSLNRPRRSAGDDAASNAPARRSSSSRYHRLRRSERRH